MKDPDDNIVLPTDETFLTMESVKEEVDGVLLSEFPEKDVALAKVIYATAGGRSVRRRKCKKAGLQWQYYKTIEMAIRRELEDAR